MTASNPPTRSRRPASPGALLAGLLCAAALSASYGLASAAPRFGTEADLVELVAATSAALEYSGRPLLPYPGDLETVIRRNGYGHCGHSAYLLARELARRGRACRLRKITLENGVIHVLADLLDGGGKPERCLDGQLGLVYPAPVAALFAAPEHAARARFLRPPDPRFRAYFGRAFFGAPRASVVDYAPPELPARRRGGGRR